MRWNGPLNKIGEYRYEIPSSYKGEFNNLKMQTSAVIYTDESMIPHLRGDNAPEQAANTTMLPGIVGKSLAMPDIHWGYGFPIGGVAATDAEKGVISPGGVGFDINCLSGETKILHEFGYIKKIKDFENNWIKEKIKCANFGKKIVNTKINAFMKFRNTKNIYKLVTESGKSIVVTEDHPFFTPQGMVKLKHLNEGESIAVHPFVGVKYYKPSHKTILTKKSLSKFPLDRNLGLIINELEKRNLLPLTMDNEKLPYLLKIMGYILGDGSLIFVKNKGNIWFYGNPEDLSNIRSDIERLGFHASRVYKRERNHEIKTFYDNIKFRAVEYSIKTTSSSLAVLLWALGVPIGNKSSQKYLLPNWIFDLELWQKRLFLSAFFGAELSSPSSVTGHGYNLYSPILSMNKHSKYFRNGQKFLEQIKNLLSHFNIVSNIIKARKEYVNAKGIVSYRFRLQISSDSENLIRLWSTVGFEYNKKRKHLANCAIQYLQIKDRVLRKRRDAITLTKKMKKAGFTNQQIYEKLNSKFVNSRFIDRSLYEKRKTPPRISQEFPLFKDFIKTNTIGLGKSGLLWDKIYNKTEVESEEFVYDFNVENSHHNFLANSFVVSNCGVRLVRTNLHVNSLNENKIQLLIDEMFKNVPSGLGSEAKIKLNRQELNDILKKGASSSVEKGYGWKQDIEFLEENGCLNYADASTVSEKAMQRGVSQVGSLGAGNHFLEIQKVADIYDPDAAKVFGIKDIGQITVMIHTGSRGFGHQVCTDHLQVLEHAVRKYNIWLPDKQLACAPVNSKEGQSYLKAMACAANFAWANRQLIVHWVRESFEKVLQDSAENMDMNIIYDVCHNIAKLEEHIVDGKKSMVYVHRKGATRAFGPGKTQVPLKYRDIGQPVLIPGDMGTESYLLKGTKESEETFGSTCHGAGRVMSRHQAVNRWRGEEIVKELKSRGIYVHAASFKVLAEEAPGAYKDIRQVVGVTHGAGISKKVVRLVPLGVVKG